MPNWTFIGTIGNIKYFNISYFVLIFVSLVSDILKAIAKNFRPAELNSPFGLALEYIASVVYAFGLAFYQPLMSFIGCGRMVVWMVVVTSWLGLTACGGTAVTPLATPADLRPAPAAGGWTVANTFSEVTFEQFESGEIVIIPLKADRKPGTDRFYDMMRAAFAYEVDVPNANLPARARFLWGSEPIDNGHGTTHYYHERLAFDSKSRHVFVLPRQGMKNVDRKTPEGTQFWCGLDEVQYSTVAIASYRYKPHVDVCPTALLRTTGEVKGPPLLLGMQKQLYVIDAGFVAGLIADLQLDQEVDRVKGAEGMNRQLTEIKKVLAADQQQLAEDRLRTALPRGQALIDRGERGALLCSDLVIGNSPAVVSGFLEDVQGDKVQLRVNAIQSPDGRSTYTLKVPIDGIAYNAGNVVWVRRQRWRACD